LLLEAGQRLGKRGLVFLLTDALDEPAPLGDALKNLRVREQDTTLIQILDRHEIEFPFDRMTEFRHPETGARLIGDPADLRARYLQRLEAHQAQVREACRKAQADYLFLDTGADLGRLLALHLIRRMLRGHA
jgi:uncharacterized protein (DUF58 family)